MYRVFMVSSIALLCMFAYASCSSWDAAQEEKTSRTQISVSGATDQTQIDADARVRIAAEAASAQTAEGQALLQAAQAANQTAQMAAQQTTQNTTVLAGALMAVTQQNSALTSQIITAQNSTPRWVTMLVIVLVLATVIGLVVGTIAMYSTWRVVQAGTPARQGAITVLPPTRTEKMLQDNGTPYRSVNGHLLAIVDGERVRIPNV